MKALKTKLLLLLSLFAIAMISSTTVNADCINSENPIFDGKCNSAVNCVSETDPQEANCNRCDSDPLCLPSVD